MPDHRSVHICSSGGRITDLAVAGLPVYSAFAFHLVHVVVHRPAWAYHDESALSLPPSQGEAALALSLSPAVASMPGCPSHHHGASTAGSSTGASGRHR